MITAQTLFARVIPQAYDRGYMLLVGFDPVMTQASAVQYVTLGGITRKSLDDTIARMQKIYGAATITDVTKSNIVKQLAKLFCEEGVPTKRAAEPVAIVDVVDPTFTPAALAMLSDAEFYQKMKTLIK